jgi:hypothetical protein
MLRPPAILKLMSAPPKYSPVPKPRFPMRAQFTGMARIQCSCGTISKVVAFQPGRWVWRCGTCERSRAVGLCFYDMPAGARIRDPADLAIPDSGECLETEALPGDVPGQPNEAMPLILHDLELWYPGRPVTQHILEDKTRVNVGRTPRKR